MNGEKLAARNDAIREFKTLREAIDSLPRDLRDKVDEAYSLAAFSHQGQKRLGGEKTQRHLERVTLLCANYARESRMPDANRAHIMAASILHDAVEDTRVTEQEIAGRFDPSIAQTVHSLSHEKLPDGSVNENEPAEVYLRRVAEGGPRALLVKRFDRLDNINSWVQVPQRPDKEKGIDMEKAREGRTFVKGQFAEARAALPLWKEIDSESAALIEQALTGVRHLEPLSSAEGITALDKLLASVQGVTFADFLRSPKGQEFLTTKKIVIAGAPQSGKSVLRELVKRSVRAVPNAPYPYFLTAAPDGEWAGFQESVMQDPDSARRMKTDYKDAIKKGGSMFTPAYVERIKTSVKNLSAPHSPLNFIDIGGKLSAENLGICEAANAAIILCGENATKVGAGMGSPEDTAKEEMDPREWKKFFSSLGIPVIAVMYSDYYGKEDVVLGVDDTGAFAGSAHYFERGELDIETRPAIKSLAEYVVSGGVEKEMYKHATLANLNATSRTARGELNVEASDGKAEALSGVGGRETADKTNENFMQVIELLYRERDKTFSDASELRTFIEGLAQKVNEGILKEGMLIRGGSDSTKFPYTRIADLPAAMEQFYNEFLERLSRGDDPKEVAGWIEYRVDLTDHFFADGCGKTAKAIGAWVLMKAKQQLPKYRGRDEYYANAPTKIRGQNSEEDKLSYESWVTYYKSLFSSRN